MAARVELCEISNEEGNRLLLIVRRDSGSTEEFFGVVTVHLREGGKVGYWLKRDTRGQGFMTEAVRAVVDGGRTNTRSPT